MKTLTMENKALLWSRPQKSGILLKRGGEIKTWKKRQFILKDAYLFYFKVLSSVEQSQPSGLIPLEGCKVGFAPYGSQTSLENVMIITLPEELINIGIVKRSNYVLAAQSYDECHSWIDEIRIAAQSKRKLKAKVDHAQLEVWDLEQRWETVKSRDTANDYTRDLPKGDYASMKFVGKEKDDVNDDPLILQALADDLMYAYHTRALLEKSGGGYSYERGCWVSNARYPI
eukprot:c21229_g1_i6 orf=277-963(+)